MKKAAFLTFAMALIAVPAASAATVLIDWSSNTDISDPAGDGKYWNSLGLGQVDLATTALVDVNNGATGFSVAVDVVSLAAGEGSGFGGSGISGPSGADPFDENGATTDGIFVNRNENGAGTATITFTGLTASTQYDFSAIGGRASNGGDGVIEVLQGVSGPSTYSLLNNGTVLDFSVTSTAGGVIEFNFREGKNDVGTTNGDGSTWNALSMTQIPEPSAALLGLFGTLLLLRRRR